MAVVLSFVIAAIATLVQKHSTFKRNFIVVLIVLQFIVLPTVTSYTFKLYNCTDPYKQGDSYLAYDVDIQCWEGDHNYYALKVGIPSIVFWIVGLPALAMATLFVYREKLD